MSGPSATSVHPEQAASPGSPRILPLHPELVRTSVPRGSATPIRDPQPFLKACRLVDSGVAVAVLLAVFVVSHLPEEPRGLQEFLSIRLSVKNVLLLIAFAAVWRGLFSWFGLYQWPKVRNRATEALRMLMACLLGGAVALIFPLASAGGAFDVSTVLYFTLFVGVTALATRSLLRAAFAPDRSAVAQVLIVGTGPRAQSVYADFVAQGDGHVVVGFVDSRSHEDDTPFRPPSWAISPNSRTSWRKAASMRSW